MAVAAVKFRRGKWVLDYRDSTKKRIVRVYPNRKEAEEARAHLTLKGPVFNPAKSVETIAEYGARWLDVRKGEAKLSTWTSYEYAFRVHIKDQLGHMPLGKLERGAVRLFVS